MKAIVASKYGPPEVLQLRNLPDPVPDRGEILVKLNAAGVTAGDARVRSLNVPFGFGLLTRLMFGFSKPRKPVLGMDFAGEIAAVGSNVSEFREGDKVFGVSEGFGAYAQYLAISENQAVSHIPKNLSVEDAAAVPFGSTTALYYLRDLGKVKPGDNVLINGASGSVGTYAIQFAKYFGAEVTGVCSSGNMELVKALGADRVIDYTKEDFIERHETYDIIFDTVGKLTFSHCKKRLTERGQFLMTVAGIPQFARVFWNSIAGRKKAVAGIAKVSKENLVFIKNLIEREKIRPIIDRKYGMNEIVQAHQYVDSGHKRGNIIISMN